jgi:hypothetical protein
MPGSQCSRVRRGVGHACPVSCVAFAVASLLGAWRPVENWRWFEGSAEGVKQATETACKETISIYLKTLSFCDRAGIVFVYPLIKLVTVG